MASKHVTRLEPIYSRRNMDMRLSINSVNSDMPSTTSTANTTPQQRVFKSPTKRTILRSSDANSANMLSPKRAAPVGLVSDAIMTDMQQQAPKQRPSMELFEPLNLMAMSQLGEPDPAAISRSDLLSAISFDRQGQILSVGDRGGRVICFALAENA